MWCTSARRRACSSTRWRCSCSSRPAARSTRAGCCTTWPTAATWSRSKKNGSAGVRHRVDDLDLQLLAVGCLVGDRLALGVPDDRVSQRALRRVHLDALGGVLHLAGTEQERLRLVVIVAGELVGHLHAGPDHTVVGGRLAHLGAVHHVLELTDPALGLALLLAGGVVAAVLAEVALLASGADAGDDLGAHRATK